MTVVYTRKNQTPAYQAKTPAVLNAYQTCNQQRIKQIAEEREIPFLVHFTQAVNLPGILQHGIVSRDHAQLYDIELYATDKYRLDNRLDAISLSVAFPNAPMFHIKRQQIRNTNWAVLLLDTRVLWEKDCSFYYENAASSQMRYATERSLKNANALEGMFYPSDAREQKGLQSYDPTSVQAEVMVSDMIEPEYIKAAVFQNDRLMNACAGLFAGMNVELGVQSLGLFGARTCARP